MATPRNGPLTEEDRADLRKLSLSLKAICKIEKIPHIHLQAMAQVSDGARKGMMKGEYNYTALTLIRLSRVLGYELALIKVGEARNIKDDPDAMIRVSQFKRKQTDAKRRERGQPEGTRVKVRKENTEGTGFLQIHSRRDILARAKGEDNIFDTD